MPVFVSPYFRASSILILSLAGTTVLALILYGAVILVFPKRFVDIGVGAEIPFIILSLLISLRYLANKFLYAKKDTADLQILGGAILLNPMFGRKSASWPFAKLSASQNRITLQTPFGSYAWEKTDFTPIVRKTGLGRWKMGYENPDACGSSVFFALPWQAKEFQRRLRDLGY